MFDVVSYKRTYVCERGGAVMENRKILHVDANSFYASAEMAVNPELRGKAVAVCGSVEKRHGIVLAKSLPAARTGIKTGMPVGEAKRLCPELVCVPPNFELYFELSEKMHVVFSDFSDKVEPFGADECWLDVGPAIKKYEDALLAANMIRERVKKELSLTVSVGVSFNKVFAKLGSDMKKPDACTVITEESFKRQIASLPVGAILGVGRSSEKQLYKYGIHTLGKLADTDESFLREVFGKCGEQMWSYANGLDFSPVVPIGSEPPLKSVGHGLTTPYDLTRPDEVWTLILGLSQDVGTRLRRNFLRCRGVCLTMRDKKLTVKQHRCRLDVATDNSADIARAAFAAFREVGGIVVPLRSLTVTAISVEDSRLPLQGDLFTDFAQVEKKQKLDCAVDSIRKRFGQNAIRPAALYGTEELFGEALPCVLPSAGRV